MCAFTIISPVFCFSDLTSIVSIEGTGLRSTFSTCSSTGSSFARSFATSSMVDVKSSWISGLGSFVLESRSLLGDFSMKFGDLLFVSLICCSLTGDFSMDFGDLVFVLVVCWSLIGDFSIDFGDLGIYMTRLRSKF